MARRLLTASVVVAAALLAAACGSSGIQVARDQPERAGAVLFNEKCGGCHTLDAAGTDGSATDIGDRERVDGPNFNVRKETMDDVLFAIRNGGFSGAIMPQNIATGQEAQQIARFLDKYSGRQADNTSG